MAPTTEKEDDTTTTDSSSESPSDSSEATSSSATSSDSTTSSESTSEETESEDDGKPKKLTTKTKHPEGTKAPVKGGKRKRRSRAITICLTNCRYEIVRRAARKFNLKEVNEDDCWNIYWTDYSVSLERAMDMRRYQIVNHFPGMNEICRKDLLARNLNRMRKLFPKEYDIYPKTWSLPADLGELQTYAHSRRHKTFICKPEMGCQGRGIFLIRNIKDLNPFGKIICQLYVAKPFLIDDLKFDMRIYVLITSCDPLRVYIYKEGLARFATAKYKTPTNTNTENSYMHLTNYAVNKFSRDYIVDGEAGTKRKLTAVYRWLEARNYDVDALVESIDSVIMKTIISAHPVLRHNYRTCFPNHDTSSACFEILGFDILLDHKLKPYVLEVNHSPSFHTDARLDLEIKEGLVQDTVRMLNIKRLDRTKVEHADRKRVQERLLVKHSSGNLKQKKDSESGTCLDAQFAYEAENSGGFRLIYPKTGSEKYDTYFEQNMSSLYAETAASQARAQLTRNQIQDFNHKKQQEEIKRALAGTKDLPLQKDKDKLRPESGVSSDKLVLVKKFRPFVANSFQPQSIDPSEELDRMKGIMHRGMLVRSLGIETQVFQLLCQVGSIKPEEERIFRRMHGFNNTNFTTQNPKTAAGSHLYQRKPQTAAPDLHRDSEKSDLDVNGNYTTEPFSARSRMVATPIDRAVATPIDRMVATPIDRIVATAIDRDDTMTPPLVTKSYQTAAPRRSQVFGPGVDRSTNGMDPFQTVPQDKFPSQPDAYNSYTIMSQMRKYLNNAQARKNTAVNPENETTANGPSLVNSVPLNSMAPFHGESAPLKQPTTNLWNRYDISKGTTGFYNPVVQEPTGVKPSYVPPKTAFPTHPPSFLQNNNLTGATKYKTQAADFRNTGNTAAQYKSLDGEAGPWKLGYPQNGPFGTEVPPKTAWNPAQTTVVTGHPIYNDVGPAKSKMKKVFTVGETAGQQQRRGNVRGSSVAPKVRLPTAALTQMFEPINYFGHGGQDGVKMSPKHPKTKLSKPQPMQQAQSSLMLTGIRIGTAPPARKYGGTM